jgi:hypothetical protein
MILTNRFRLFNKKGYSLSADYTNPIVVEVVQPSGGTGTGAVINAYTDPSTEIVHVEILSGGVDYPIGSYLSFTDVFTQQVLDTDPTDITLSSNGTITSFTMPADPFNFNFTYPATSFFVNQFLEPVSTGLIASDHIFIIEEVFDANGKKGYTYPRVDEYGPFEISEYAANGTTGNVKVKTIPITGNVIPQEPNRIVGISPATIALLNAGLYVTGTGIIANTQIEEVNTAFNYIVLSANPTITGAISIEAYEPHNLRVGNTIRIFDTVGSNLLDGRHTVTAVDYTHIYFESSLQIPVTSVNTLRYGVIPIFRAYLDPTSDSEFFLFSVTYNEDYPTITKQKDIYFELTDASIAPVPDLLPSGNGIFQRQVFERLDQQALQFNIGLQSDYEGVYAAQINIDDITYPEVKKIFLGLYEGETVAEDERFGKLLENFGREVTPVEELILRDSDVNEDLPDNILLNAKRREMLLEGDNIWPYVGSYRGLVNMVNWFGYYDIRIKEYWLNVNQEDEYFGKYRQLQIPFQLKDKGKDSEAITLLPSKHYKKTSLFGLFYDLVKDGGTFDVNGVPDTVDAFEYTNEEILIKLFALKRYLKDKFLPLNARIVDITGEGVYYERYSVNSWNDPVNYLQVDLTRDIDFTVNKREIQVVDARPYDPTASLQSPPYFDVVQNYTYKYNVNKILISNPGGPYFGVIPEISVPGQALQQVRAYVRMQGAALAVIAPLTPSGTGYQPGDVITLAGGTYENPIRITVNTVGPNGEVTNFAIDAGPHQGSNYASMPTSGFSQATVFRADLSGNQYVPANANGFTCLSTDIPFQAESVVIYDKGLEYSNLPTVVFTPAIGGISATLDLTTLGATPVGYYNNGAPLEPYVDAPGIPVGAPLELSTSFDITWDEVPYRWQDLGGASDATLRSVVSTLPTGSGQLLAVEILNPGDGYRYTPQFTVAGGGGFGGSVSGELKNGKLKILEYTVYTGGSSIGTNDILIVSGGFPAGGINAISPGRIVKGLGIPDDVVTSVVNQPFSEIYLTNADGSPVSLPLIPIGSPIKILIHQGAFVTATGASYTSAPNVAPNGGQVGNLYTWDELGRGDFYQMEWKVTLTAAEQPGQQFNYVSGIKKIDDLISHKVLLPYTGKYTLELIVYDTDNNYINEIKNNYVTAFLPEATYSWSARYISDCADTWDEFYQIPIPEFEPSQGQLAPPPAGLRYNWENANGRWVNPIFTVSTWDDSRITWDHIEVGNLSPVNSWNYPPTTQVDVIQVSAQDNLEGSVISYTDANTTPSSINPTIIVSGQRPYPQIEPVINPNDWIFIRRDGVIYQLEVLASDYSVPGQTKIELLTTPSDAFRNNPTAWEVLREIAGTVVLDGNQIYDPVNNPTGIAIGEYIMLSGLDNIPKRDRVGITAKDVYGTDPNAIILTGGGTDPIYYPGGELGQIYKFRGINPVNGNLFWNPTSTNSTWVIESAYPNDPYTGDHLGKLYILDATPPVIGCQPANPTAEIRPGFTIIHLYVELGGAIIYDQQFRTIHAFLDTSTTGHPYDIWSGTPTGYAGVHVIDIATLDGGSIISPANLTVDLNTYLNTQAGAGANIWLEYEYETFPTRTYLGQNNAGNAEIYMDFNMYPSSGSFTAATPLEFPADPITGLGWWYDHGIASGNFSLFVTNTGTWRNGLGTIITVNDNQSELLRISSSFTGSQLNFDEDSAETKLGTLVQTWENSRALLWDETCFHSFDTLDYQHRFACNFRISGVDQNGSIQFNNDVPFLFQGIVGGMSNAQKWSQALYELRETDNTGLSRYDYQITSPSTPSDAEYFLGTLYTYDPATANQILNVVNPPSGAPATGDVVVSAYTEPAATISSFAGTTITMTNPLPKKLQFLGDTVNGSVYIRNIQGLIEGSIYVGEILTGLGLPSFPAAPAEILEIVSVGGHVRQIKLNQPATSTLTQDSIFVEWDTKNNPVSFQLLQQNGSFYIDAYAKTPSVDQLGWLLGQNNVFFYDWTNNLSVPLCHTYPIRNVIQRFGFGNGLIGGFENGLNEFLINERSLQVFYYEGLNPVGGTRGWYPAQSLPPQYSFIVNDPLPQPPAIDNVLEAEAQSNRLPYERGIGGAFRWEETYIGIQPTKLPSGSSVLLSSDASTIAGKTNFFWVLRDENNDQLVELVDPTFMWTFNQPGKFTLSLVITDTNGNKKEYSKKDFFEIYETT